MKRNMYDEKVFYGWYVVAAAFIMMATGWGIIFNTASLFIEPVSTDLALSRQSINFTFTIRSICQLVIYLFSGIIFSKLKIKNLMKVASIILPISIFLHSYVEGQSMLYLLTIISGISIVLLGSLPLSVILNNWFYEKKGFVIGLALMGSGLGGMLFNFLSGIWISTYGWRITYKILAIIIFITIVPCVFFVLKIRPQEIGLSPLGKPESNGIDGKDVNETEESGLMLSDARRTTNFWGICLSTALITMSGVSLMNNVSPHLTNIGYSATFSANITALVMGSLAIGKLILGNLYDKIGVRKATFISCISIAIGCFSMIYAQHNIALVMLVLTVGIGCSFLTVALPIITQMVFGQRDYNSILGIISASHSLGGMISPMIIGYIYDLSQSYNPSYTMMTILAVISTLFFQLSLPKEKKILQN